MAAAVSPDQTALGSGVLRHQIYRCTVTGEKGKRTVYIDKSHQHYLGAAGLLSVLGQFQNPSHRLQPSAVHCVENHGWRLSGLCTAKIMAVAVERIQHEKTPILGTNTPRRDRCGGLDLYQCRKAGSEATAANLRHREPWWRS